MSPLLLLLSCGGDQGFQRLYADIAWAPDALDFGQVRKDQAASLVLQVGNAGEGELSVNGVTLGEERADLGLSTTTLDLGRGESGEIELTWTPTALGTLATTLNLLSNDPEHPVLSLPLTGEAIAGGPDLRLDTKALDFGAVEVGASASRAFTIRNAGDEELTIEASSPQSGSGAFALLSDPRGRSLAPGATYSVLVQYSPTQDQGDQGALELRSDDPDRASVEVSFVGNGGGGGSYPVAIIAGPTSALPEETVLLDGSGSHDPDGNTPLSYRWTLVAQPEASGSALTDTEAETTSLWLDAAGDYTIALQVENSLGVPSATALHRIAAVPEDDVYVLLSWNRDAADMDLHLLRADGTALFQSPDDCCWCNPNPDWSGASPRLALDAASGGGPETVVLPTAGDGDYFVRVHYFQDDGAGTTQATVRVFVRGEVVDQYRRELRHNQVWDVAWVRWPTGYVIEENADPYASPRRSCTGG